MIKLQAWPRGDGMIEVEGGGTMWRGSPAEAKAYVEGMQAGLDIASRVARSALGVEFDDRRPVEAAPPLWRCIGCKLTTRDPRPEECNACHCREFARVAE